MARPGTDLRSEVESLRAKPRDELVERWARVHGTAPPGTVRTELLVWSAAHDLQIKRTAGLSVSSRRLLKAAVAEVEASCRRLKRERQNTPAVADVAPTAVEDLDDSVSSGGPRPQRLKGRRTPLPGARLLRDWNGRTHIVDVIDGGFVFEARVYRSLSAIARQITGAHWSGPRFFGL